MHSFSRNLRQRAALTLAGLLLFAFASLIFSGMTGSVSIPLSDIPAALNELLHGQSSTLAATLLDLRASRAVSAFVTGAALSLAGVMMQALLRNPLADPYVLGLSAGASVGALAALMFCAPPGWWMLQPSAARWPSR